MSELVVTSAGFVLQPTVALRNGPAILRWAYNRNFLDSDGNQILAGTQNSGFGVEVACAIADGLITVDEDSTLWTTDDAQDPSPASIWVSAWLLTPRGVLIAQLTIAGKAQFVVTESLTPSCTWAAFSNYNQAVFLSNMPPTYFTAAEVERVIDQAFDTNPASDTQLGTVLLTVPADIPASPVVWGANDPLVRDAVSLEGIPISDIPPLDSQVLTYNQANNTAEWGNQNPGTGNVISNEVVSVDGQLTLASGTGGKTIKFSSITDDGAEFNATGMRVIAAEYDSDSANLADNGTVRLNKDDFIAWRNEANGGNILLEKDASDRIASSGGFAGALTGNASTATALNSTAVTGSGIVMNTNKLLGRGTAASGAIEEITLGSNLSLTGTTLNVSGAAGGDIKADGTVPFAADESMGGFSLTNLATPDDLTDAANKDFVLQSVAAAVQQTPNITALVSGGGVLWEADYDFRVSQATYLIQGDLFSSVEQTITLDAADPALDRIDVIALDDTGTVVKITGTAAAQPSQPDVDPGTQLLLTFVFVGALTTAPSNVTNEDIYIDNAEWTATTSGSGWDVNSTNNPHSGTKDIEGTAVASNAYVQLQAPAPLTLDTYALLSVFIRSKATWPKNRSLLFQWYSAGVAKGVPVTINTGFFGFDSSQIATYQLLAIPMGQFAVPAGTSINQLRITDKGGAIGMYIDDLVLQAFGGDIGPPPTSGLTQEQADARYLQQANNLSDAVTPNTALNNILPTQAAQSGKVLGTNGTNTSWVTGTGSSVPTTVQGDTLYASAANTLTALTKDTNATRYLSNTGASNNPAWAQVSLTQGVSGDLPLANLAPASGASLLLGRGSAGGAGDYQEVTLGANMSMSGTTLSASGGTIVSSALGLVIATSQTNYIN